MDDKRSSRTQNDAEVAGAINSASVLRRKMARTPHGAGGMENGMMTPL